MTALAFALALSLTMAAINGYWLWLVGAVGVAGVLWLFMLKATTHLLLVFAFLPFQSLLNDIFAGRIPAIAVAKDGLMLVVLLAMAAHYLIRRRPWYVNNVITMLLIFAVIGAMCALSSPYLLRGILALRFLTLYPLIILLMANAMETREEVNRLLRLVAVAGVITVVYGIVQYATLFDVPYRTAGGDVTLRMGRFDEMGAVSTFASRPTFGGYLSPLFLLFLQDNLWKESKFKTWMRLPILGAIGVCVILTFSRSSWLALLVGTLVALYFRDKLKAVLAAAGLGVCGILFFVVQAVSPSSSLATAATDNESFFIRLSYWPMVARHVLVHPFGIGLGTVGGPHLFEAGAEADIYGNLRYDQNASFDPNAELGPDGVISVTDNSFLKLFIQGGFPLLIAFLCFVGAVIRLARDVLRSTPGGPEAEDGPEGHDSWARDIAIWATASFASLLTIFMFVDFMESAPAISLYWMALGALCCAKKFTQAQPAEEVATEKGMEFSL